MICLLNYIAISFCMLKTVCQCSLKSLRWCPYCEASHLWVLMFLSVMFPHWRNKFEFVKKNQRIHIHPCRSGSAVQKSDKLIQLFGKNLDLYLKFRSELDLGGIQIQQTLYRTVLTSSQSRIQFFLQCQITCGFWSYYPIWKRYFHIRFRSYILPNQIRLVYSSTSRLIFQFEF